MVWHSHLFKNFPQFVVLHTVEGFGIVNKVEVDDFPELSCLFSDRTDVGNLTSVPLSFLIPAEHLQVHSSWTTALSNSMKL